VGSNVRGRLRGELTAFAPNRIGAVKSDVVRDARNADLLAVSPVALPDHCERVGSKCGEPAAHRLRHLLSGETEEQRDFHVRGLAGG
jgi:hypothetical protein